MHHLRCLKLNIIVLRDIKFYSFLRRDKTWVCTWVILNNFNIIPYICVYIIRVLGSESFIWVILFINIWITWLSLFWPRIFCNYFQFLLWTHIDFNKLINAFRIRRDIDIRKVFLCWFNESSALTWRFRRFLSSPSIWLLCREVKVIVFCWN